MSSSFQISTVHLSLRLFSFMQRKDKCASYSFTTKKVTHIMCQVSLVVKYILIKLYTNRSLSFLTPLHRPTLFSAFGFTAKAKPNNE